MEVKTSQAARICGVFPHELYTAILMGRLEARKDSNGHWLISKQSLERWNSRRVRRSPKPQQGASEAHG
jgi:hypothetical protein